MKAGVRIDSARWYETIGYRYSAGRICIDRKQCNRLQEFQRLKTSKINILGWAPNKLQGPRISSSVLCADIVNGRGDRHIAAEVSLIGSGCPVIINGKCLRTGAKVDEVLIRAVRTIQRQITQARIHVERVTACPAGNSDGTDQGERR